MKKIFTFLVVLMAIAIPPVVAAPSDTIYYTSTDGAVITPNPVAAFGANITDTGYEDGRGYIAFDGPVTEIGDHAFFECKTLESIVVPAAVTVIEENAFELCGGLKSVDLPDGLLEIGVNAFMDCGSLPSVVIPNSVTAIGAKAFDGCESLVLAVLPEGITQIESGVFSGCEALLFIEIPSGVTAIGDKAFEYCKALRYIRSHAMVPPALGKNAFRDVPSNTPVYVPCNCVGAYVGVKGWKNFTNIQEPPTPLFTLTLDFDASMGSVEILSENECRAIIKATPASEHYHLAAWSDDEDSTVLERDIRMSEDSTIKAIFAPNKYKITTTSNNTAAGKTYGDAVADYGSEVTISAVANFGYRFKEWEGESAEDTVAVKVLGDETYNALFVQALVDTAVTAFICKDEKFWDPYKNDSVLISSAKTWVDSVRGVESDTIYTFVVAPFVAPDTLASGLLDTIGAMPVLVHGLEPDTAGTLANILKYYADNDKDSIANIENARWSYVGKIDCGAISYPMTLVLEDECGKKHKASYVFPLDTTVARDTILVEDCESYEWKDSIYTESGKYVRVDKNIAGCDSAYHYLDLTIWGVDTIDTVYNICPGTMWLGEKLLYKDTTLISESKNEHGCKTINVTKYHVYEPIPVTRVDTSICYGDTLEWLGEKYWYDVDHKDTLNSVVTGCDSVVQLILNVWDSVPVTIEKFTICEGQTYVWPVNNTPYTVSTIDSVVLTDQHGCDSVVKLDLTVMPKLPVDTLYDTICHGMTYEWELADTLKFTISGNDFDQVMTKEVTMKTTCNCDSVVVLHLTELAAIPETTVVDTICYGGEYWFEGVWYKESLVDTFTLTSKVTGCDSIVYLNLHVLDSIPVTVVDSSICYGSSIIWFDDTLSINIDGRRDTVKTIHGCDSIIELKLTILPEVKPNVINDTVCFGESYYWDVTDRYYPASTTYADTTVLNGQKCDSLIILYLHILDSIAPVTHVYDTICNGDPYTWTLSADSVLVLDGTTFDGNKEVTRTLQTAYGCDSVVTLHLTELPAIEPAVTYATICEGEMYQWEADGEPYYESDTVEITKSNTTGCDSIFVLYLTVLPKREIIELNETICHGDTFTITHDGIDHKFTSTIRRTFDYKDINGCDSIVRLNLTVREEVPVDVRKVTTCFGVPYRWDVNDVTYPAKDTTVTVTKTNTKGCDSLIVLELTVLPEIPMNTIDTTTCFGVPFVWDGDTIPLDVTSPATLIDTLISSTGCDSVVTLNIRMLPEIPVVTIDTTICYGEKCLFRDSLYSESTELEFNLTSELTGCDSTVYFRLTVLDSIPAKTVSATTCFGVPYEIGDSVIVGSVTNKKIVLESTTGCDSIVYLTLKELAEVDTTRHTAYLCYGDSEYYWETNEGVKTYTAATTDTVTLKNINGCDSVVIFNLIEMPELVETIDDTICYADTIEWNGMKCYAAGTYHANVKSVISGCDSTAILNLTVLPEVEETIIVDSICPGDTLKWNGYTLTGADTVSITELDANGCPAVTTLYLGVRTPDTTYVYETICEGDTYNWKGDELTENDTVITTYPNRFGCESVEIFYLTVIPKIETIDSITICYHDSITWNDSTYVGSEVGIGGAEVQVRLTSAQGCDSIAHLVLTVLPEVQEVEVDRHMCAGETYTLNGIVYATDTVVRDTLKTVEHGCHSVIVYNLHFWPVIDTVVYDTICYGDTLIWVNDTALITSGIYTRTLTSEHGCDSTVTLHLHVLPEVVLVPETISACDSLEWNGKVYTTSGIYRDTLTTVHGCDSIAELHLTIHNSVVIKQSETVCDSIVWQDSTYFVSGVYYDTLTTVNGCDSILELTLTVNHSTVGTPEERFICFGDSTVWEGVAYDSTGIYTTTLTNAVGCDSIATLQLTVLSEMVVDSSQVTICPSALPYMWYGDTLKAAGTYYAYEKFVKNTSCDSAEHKLTLVVLPNASSDTTIVACDEYTWNGVTYTASGDYTFNTTAANGCDSIATLHLTVNYSNTSDTYMTLCFGDSVTWNGMVCDSTKTYVDTLTNAAGCDSIAYLHLTILPDVIVDQDSATVCPSDLPYSWRSYSLTKAGLYYDTLRYTLGCDSIIYEMNLKVLKPDTVILTWTTCDSIVWNGLTCTLTDQYVYSTKGSDGCDSVTILDLTVTHTIYENVTVVACDSFPWNGKTYTTSGEYTFTTTAANGCDSVTTLYLTVNYSTVGDPEERFICYGDTTEWEGQKYFKTDLYTTTLTNAAGCDSTAYLQLTVLAKMVTEYENIYACPSECPYKWNDQYLTASGTYYYYEQFVDNEDCDSVEHVLTFTVYDMSLPTTVTTPISICGKAVYTLDATEEVEAHIASIPTYAPGAKVVWQEWADGVWSDYTYEPLKGSQDSVIMRYVVVSDCGTTASARMNLVVEQPTPENSPELDDLSVKSKYDSRIFLFDLNAFTATFGWTPAPEQVKWFKLVGTMDVYGEGGDDEFVGSGHSYNLPEGDIIAGSYYAIVDQPAIDVDDCDVVYRSVILTGAPSPAAPKLVPNVARPNEMLTIKNLSADQIHEILVFDANGKLITTYKADRVSEFMFNASHTSGYYLVDIINTNGSTTLRYVVK